MRNDLEILLNPVFLAEFNWVERGGGDGWVFGMENFGCALPEHLGRCIFGPEFAGDHVMAKREQITVPLPARLREFVERQAQQSDRSMAGVIRHVLAEAARREPEPQEQAA